MQIVKPMAILIFKLKVSEILVNANNYFLYKKICKNLLLEAAHIILSYNYNI